MTGYLLGGAGVGREGVPRWHCTMPLPATSIPGGVWSELDLDYIPNHGCAAQVEYAMMIVWLWRVIMLCVVTKRTLGGMR